MENGQGSGFVLIIWLLVMIVIIAGIWKVFTKAGKPGWASIIPIYNIVVLLEIVGRPLWWVVLYFVPLANFVIAILVGIDLAKAFGKGTGFGIGLTFLAPIFYPILGFGSAQYRGASAPVAA
ncbi:MAG: signal peptidase I [Verrucomicrobia bacterium]|nr:signal peptidase I [Verrucomicrobiota bacterium]